MFEVLKVSSLIKKGLSSTCRVILAWKLALASRKSSSKYWRFVLELIYISLYGSILRESHNEHNSQTSSTRNTNELLEPQRHQSYNTNSSWQWGQTDQIKCGVNLHCSAKYLKFIAKYLLARQFLMSRRQCSSNELLSLQKCQFFFCRTQFLEFCLRFLILLIVYWIVFCLVSSNVKSTRNNDSKLFQKFLFL